MVEAEPEVSKYDTHVGDGDCGLCLKTSAEAVLLHIHARRSPTRDRYRTHDREEHGRHIRLLCTRSS